MSELPTGVEPSKEPRTFEEYVKANERLTVELNNKPDTEIATNICTGIQYVLDSHHRFKKPIPDRKKQPTSFVNAALKIRNPDVVSLSVLNAYKDLNERNPLNVTLGTHSERFELLEKAVEELRLQLPNYYKYVSYVLITWKQKLKNIITHEEAHRDAAHKLGWGAHFSLRCNTTTGLFLPGHLEVIPGTNIYPKELISVDKYYSDRRQIVFAAKGDLSRNDRLELDI